MRKILKSLVIWSSLMLLFNACYNDNEYDLYPFSGAQCDSTNVSYSKTIVPITSANCNSCHSTSNPSGNVITDTWAGLSKVANNGKLWGGVNWEPGYVTMPNLGVKLSACDLGKIKNWINQGAPNN
ncbi:MAG: cytochrome c [Bacteroidetes bacterium]|nr:cytochrome c [Bacteroidota bacterium]